MDSSLATVSEHDANARRKKWRARSDFSQKYMACAAPVANAYVRMEMNPILYDVIKRGFGVSSEINGAGSLTKAFSRCSAVVEGSWKIFPSSQGSTLPTSPGVGLVLVPYHHPCAQPIKTLKMPPNQTLVYENEDTELVPSYEKKGKELSKKIVYKRRTRKRRWA